MPPVKVITVNGAEDVSIKITDRGGGVSRSTMKHVWKFAHSTSDADDDYQIPTTTTTQDSHNVTTDGSLLCGTQIRGFGLPLARVYARYFGGELTLKSMEGFGCDAYLYLPRLGDSCENLPPSVISSPGERDSLPNRSSNTTTTTTTTAAAAATKRRFTTATQQLELQEQQRTREQVESVIKLPSILLTREEVLEMNNSTKNVTTYLEPTAL